MTFLPVDLLAEIASSVFAMPPQQPHSSGNTKVWPDKSIRMVFNPGGLLSRARSFRWRLVDSGSLPRRATNLYAAKFCECVRQKIAFAVVAIYSNTHDCSF